MSALSQTPDPRGRLDILLVRLSDAAGQALVRRGYLTPFEWDTFEPYVNGYFAQRFKPKRRRRRRRKFPTR